MHFARRIADAVQSSLKLKLVLLIVTILAVTIGIAPWSAIKMQETQLLQASGERLRTLHELLRESVVDTCMLTGDRESVQKVLQAVSTHRDIEHVRIFDTAGRIHFSSQPAERGRNLDAAEMSRYVGQAGPLLWTDYDGAVTHSLVRPLFNQPACMSCHPPEQKIVGILQVSLSLAPTWQQLDRLKRRALLATLLTLAVIVIGIWLSLTFLIDQPLQELVAVMGHAEHGDLSARVPVQRTDELGRLARHFNEMISKLDDAQREIERYHREQLARADRLATVGEMAAAIAHEIRNPLTGISGVLSVLSRDFPPDDSRREVVRQSHLLIDRLNRSVEDILHYSRPSLPQFQPVRLADIVDRALSLVAGEAAKARIRIVREVGDQGAPLTVYADPPQLQQVFINLLLNALQASSPEAQIVVRVCRREPPGEPPRACVEIEDRGKGMSADDAAKVFQPFFSTKAQGTGLGLSIAKQIVEQHRGRISLRSAPGTGTCVSVELPVHPDATPTGT
ncbi:MAG TPA: ATP-binding protein [Candidatus Kryptonia bacterium]|nr:ATP-binding protein [Candidatus Kryptonia bacterium]